jgi:predicted ribosome quality control (RQC) complex YloA/Tae2 family protein
VAQAAVRAFRGVSPSLARDLAAAAGVPAEADPADLAAEQWQSLHAAWCDWLHRLAAARFDPTCCPASGAYSLLGTQPQRVPALLPFLHAYYTAPQQGEALHGLRQQLERAVAAAAARLERKAAALRRQGAQGDQHAATQRQADLIMANLHRWGRAAGRHDGPGTLLPASCRPCWHRGSTSAPAGPHPPAHLPPLPPSHPSCQHPRGRVQPGG